MKVVACSISLMWVLCYHHTFVVLELMVDCILKRMMEILVAGSSHHHIVFWICFWFVKLKYKYKIQYIIQLQNDGNTCGRLVCRQLLCLDCNCGEGGPLLGRFLPPGHNLWHHIIWHHFLMALVVIWALKFELYDWHKGSPQLMVNLEHTTVHKHKLKRCHWSSHTLLLGLQWGVVLVHLPSFNSETKSSLHQPE